VNGPFRSNKELQQELAKIEADQARAKEQLRALQTQIEAFRNALGVAPEIGRDRQAVTLPQPSSKKSASVKKPT
jgi:hypothetical protein